MKKSILIMLTAFTFITCNKSKTSPATTEPVANNTSTTAAGSTSKSLAAPPTLLCYVTYNSVTGMSYLVKFNPITGAVTSNLPISGLAGEKVAGGIARRMNTAGTYDYFITTCNIFSTSTPVHQKQLNLVSAAIIPGPLVTLNSAANTTADYKNYLLENAPSLQYYYRTAGSIYYNSTAVTGVPFSYAVGAFASHNGSICFGALNASYNGAFSCQNPMGLGGGATGNVYRNANITVGGGWGFLVANPYAITIADFYHCLTVDDALNGMMYLSYSGKYGSTGNIRTTIAYGLISSGTFSTFNPFNFPCGTTGALANISDIEVVY